MNDERFSEDGLHQAFAEIAGWGEGSTRPGSIELGDRIDMAAAEPDERWEVSGRRSFSSATWAAAVLVAVVGLGSVVVWLAQRQQFDVSNSDQAATVRSEPEAGSDDETGLESIDGSLFADRGPDGDASSSGGGSPGGAGGGITELSPDGVFAVCTALDDISVDGSLDSLSQSRAGLLDLLAEIRSTRAEILSSLAQDASLDEEQRRAAIEAETARLDAEEERAEEDLRTLDALLEDLIAQDLTSLYPPNHLAHVSAGTPSMVMSETAWGAAAAIVTSADGISACGLELADDGTWVAQASHLTQRPGQRLLARLVSVDGAVELAPDDEGRSLWLLYGGADDDLAEVRLVTSGGGGGGGDCQCLVGRGAPSRDERRGSCPHVRLLVQGGERRRIHRRGRWIEPDPLRQTPVAREPSTGPGRSGSGAGSRHAGSHGHRRQAFLHQHQQ